jgi:hypothetical protein
MVNTDNESDTSDDQSYTSIIDEIEEVVSEVIDDYMGVHVLEMSKPDFYEMMLEDVVDTVMDIMAASVDVVEQSEDEGIKTRYNRDTIYTCVDEIMTNYWEMIGDVYPLRSEKSIAEKQAAFYKTKIGWILQKLDSTKDNQGEEEWYMTRNSVITASSAWKVFASQAQQNSLIYEKCRAEVRPTGGNRQFITSNSMQHGHKYEPVSILLYEYLFKTRIQGYGCIIHPSYSFLGASPDGINVDPESTRYGRMVEIKNVVNRDITGIPKEEYWIQMQIQMEVCDLDTCDFIETRFQEYMTDEECYADTETREYRGLILYFVKNNENNTVAEDKYEYMPPTIQPTVENRVQVNSWIQHKKRELFSQGYHLYGQQYWYLDEFSCLLVRRNRQWFEAAISKIESIWNTIQEEKVGGYSHRAPQKKVNTQNQTTDWLVSKLDYADD